MMKVVLLCCLLVVAKADSGGGSGGFDSGGGSGGGSGGFDCGGSGGTGSGGFGGSGGTGSGGFGGSGGTGSGGSGGNPCYAMEASACDDYDYDQAACEEATDCMWDDLNGCDVVVHANACEPDCSGRCGGESDGCDGSCDEECEPEEETEGGCVHDFTEMGAADCDVAWGEFGVNCAALASNYGWDCEGCSCPGDTAEEEQGEQEESGCVHDFTEMGAANCDVAWSSFGVNCASLQSDYAWDCSGCSCPGDEAEEEEQGEQETSGCGGSGGSGSGGSGCGDEGASMCDEYDYDQAACEEHSEYREEEHYHCVWDDLNGCDVVLHPHEIECENPCAEDFANTGACGTTDWENATEVDLCHCAISVHYKNGNRTPNCGYPSPLGDGCRTTHETLDICNGVARDWSEPKCDNECPEGFNDTEVCNTTDWENATEEDLCHCAMSVAKKMGANMLDCGYSSPFGDGCRNTHETIRRCTPEAEPTFMCGEHADDNGCLEQCGCRWVADNNADKANADNADNADKAPRPRGFCLDDSAEEAIAALLGMDEMHVMSLLNLATNEEFAQMAADHNIDLKDISAHDLAYDMYHTSDSDRLINSITNLESMELSEKMAVGNVFKQLNEAMSGDNKGFCEDDKEAGAMTVVATGAAVVAALGAILM